MTDDNTLATFNALFPTDHADPNRRSRLSLFEKWLNANAIKWHDARLDEYRDYLLHVRQLAPLSVRNHLATIRQRYRDLLEDNQVISALEVMAIDSCETEGFEANPANVQAVVNRWIRLISNNTSPKKAQVKVLKETEHEDGKFIRLTPDEIDARLAAIPQNKQGRRDAAIIALLYACGLREQEGADADVSDLFQKYKGEFALRVPKGKGGVKRLVVYGVMWRYIEFYVLPWLEVHAITSGRVLRAYSPGSGLLLPSISVDTIRRSVVLWMGCRPHDLRRSYAKNLRDSGMAIEAIQQQLAHKHIQTTLRYIGELDARDRTPR